MQSEQKKTDDEQEENRMNQLDRTTKRRRNRARNSKSWNEYLTSEHVSRPTSCSEEEEEGNAK
jgi:hypothetical protein